MSCLKDGYRHGTRLLNNQRASTIILSIGNLPRVCFPHYAGTKESESPDGYGIRLDVRSSKSWMGEKKKRNSRTQATFEEQEVLIDSLALSPELGLRKKKNQGLERLTSIFRLFSKGCERRGWVTRARDRHRIRPRRHVMSMPPSPAFPLQCHAIPFEGQRRQDARDQLKFTSHILSLTKLHRG